MNQIAHHLIDQPTTLNDWAKSHFNDLDRFQFLLDLGAIYHNKIRVQSDVSLSSGDYLRIHNNPRRFSNFNWSLIHRSDDFLVLNKPGGLPSHPTLDNSKENLKHLVESELGQTVYLPHRLDIVTSGLMVFALNPDFAGQFGKSLEAGEIEKSYTAFCSSPVELGVHTHYMLPSDRVPKQVVDSASAGAKECRLKILSCEKENDFYKLEIQLITGRTHQIRAQLAHLGSPIIGDGFYHSDIPLNDLPLLTGQQSSEPIALCCTQLIFSGHNFSVENSGDWLPR